MNSIKRQYRDVLRAAHSGFPYRAGWWRGFLVGALAGLALAILEFLILWSLTPW